MKLTDVVNWANELTSHHSPSPAQIESIAGIRAAAKTFLEAIVLNCPPCADRSAAIRKVREAMMTANAAIVVPAIKDPV